MLTFCAATALADVAVSMSRSGLARGNWRDLSSVRHSSDKLELNACDSPPNIFHVLFAWHCALSDPLVRLFHQLLQLEQALLKLKVVTNLLRRCLCVKVNFVSCDVVLVSHLSADASFAVATNQYASFELLDETFSQV